MKHTSEHASVRLPLFRDEHLDTGGEYQIALHLGRRRPGLIETICPEDVVPYEEQLLSRPLMKITYQIPPPEQALQHEGIGFPRFGIQLGTLMVRSNFRRKKNSESKASPFIEYTDYQIIVDAEREAMPVWIMCSRRTLQERHDMWGGWNPNLPIFKGLLGLEERGLNYDEFRPQKPGYDAACIFDSVHRLGERPSFEEACDLVQRTRAVVDPGIRDAHLAKLEEIIGGPVPVQP